MNLYPHLHNVQETTNYHHCNYNQYFNYCFNDCLIKESLSQLHRGFSFQIM